MDAVVTTIPFTAVTDAKDVYDKGQSDTPSYGSQKSLCFSKAWLTALRWTSAKNMWVDSGAKDMSPEHVAHLGNLQMVHQV